MFGFGKRRVEKLDFLVVGAQKSGTTALNYYLKRHPYTALPIKKSLHFFDNDELFAGGNVSYEPLHEMFRPARPGSIAGENTPIFLFLGLSSPRFRAVEAHDIPYARKLRDEERMAVRKILESDIGRLEALLSWDCSNWR